MQLTNAPPWINKWAKKFIHAFKSFIQGGALVTKCSLINFCYNRVGMPIFALGSVQKEAKICTVIWCFYLLFITF